MEWKDQKDKREKGRDGGKEGGITSAEENQVKNWIACC